MNRFVKVAGIALVSLLAVAGVARAQTWLQWKAPLNAFPMQSEIIPPIDTGSVAQPRGGVINVSSTIVDFPLKFSSTTAQGFNIWGGKFNLNGDLTFPKPIKSGLEKGLVFADGTVQIEAAYGRLGKGKFCSVIGNGWRDSFQVVDDFTRAACAKYAADTAASTWQIGCLSGSGVRWGTNLPPTPNCGWDTPAAPPPPPDCFYWYTDRFGIAHYKPQYNCP